MEHFSVVYIYLAKEEDDIGKKVLVIWSWGSLGGEERLCVRHD